MKEIICVAHNPCFHHLHFQKYCDDSAVFEPNLKIVFADQYAAFRHGVAEDWSNVEIIGRRPTYWVPYKEYQIIKSPGF